MIFIYKVTAGQEKVVADVLKSKIKKESAPVYTIVLLEDLKGYIIIEADKEATVRRLAARIPHIRGVLKKAIDISEVDSLIKAKPVGLRLSKGDVVELISGPFKGEKAKIIKMDENKDEVTVELIEVAVPIPVTVKANTLRLFQRAEEAR